MIKVESDTLIPAGHLSMVPPSDTVTVVEVQW